MDTNEPELMDLKDTDKYKRQIGSKALIATNVQEAREYEHKRQLLLNQKNRMDNIENRLGQLEKNVNLILDILQKNAD